MYLRNEIFTHIGKVVVDDKTSPATKIQEKEIQRTKYNLFSLNNYQK